MTNFSLTPPAADVLEVSLFGCGVGEALLIHVGHNEWVAIDSCRHPSSSNPVALDYLAELGIQPNAVKLVLITHWHDDHVGGMAALAQACSEAKIAIPSALTRKEFTELVAAFTTGGGQIDLSKSGVREISKIFTLLQKSREEKQTRYLLVQQDTTVFRSALGARTEIIALSPSHEAILAALDNYSTLLPDGERRVLVTPEQNHNAIALWIKFGEQRVLLGSDLEEHSGRPNLGWTAALGCSLFPDNRAAIFKIPHHGSHNAHHDEVWNQLLMPEKADRRSIMTTFNRGTTPLPRQSDIDRIKARTDVLHCTTVPKVALQRRDATVERVIREVVVPGSRVPLTKSYGHIRYRLDLAGTVELTSRGSVEQL